MGRERAFCHCPNCDHWWLEPFPDEEELNAYYQGCRVMVTTGYTRQYPRKKLNVFRAILTARQLLEKTSFLEIGPGPVGIAPILPIGATYYAVEPGIAYSRALGQIAEKRQLDLHVYDYIELVPRESRVDVLFANAVFEHLRDPLYTFTTAVRLLRPGATVVFGVPDRSIEIPEYAFVPSGFYKNINYGENHLHSFSQASVKALFEQGGVELIDTCHMLKQRLIAAYHQLSSVWEEGVVNQRMMSVRWMLQYARRLFEFRIANYVIDRRRSGDDRCEAVYIGIKRHQIGCIESRKRQNETASHGKM
jgi:SAM-dependent methyltransferase